MESLLGRGETGRRHPRVIRKVPFPCCPPSCLLSGDRAGCVSCLNSIHARAGLHVMVTVLGVHAGGQRHQAGVSPLFGDADAWGPFEGPAENGAGFSLQRH